MRCGPLLAGAAALCFALGACGSSGETTGAPAPVTSAPSPQAGQGSTDRQGSTRGAPESAAADGSRRGDEGGEQSHRRVPVAPLRVSGGGSVQFRVRGGDNSVQDFGAEAGASELGEAAATVHRFFVARVWGEWDRACSLLSAREVERLDQLTAPAPGAKGQGCPAALAALTAGVSPALARALTTVDAASLRQEGKQAFLIYTGPPGRTVYAMPLVGEAGGWRLGAFAGAELSGL